MMKTSIFYPFVFVLLVASCSSNDTDETVHSDENSNETENVTTNEAENNTTTAEDVIEMPIESQPTSEKNYQEFHPNGNLKIEGDHDPAGNRTGLWISYYENGTKWSESMYIKGLKDGHSITFFPNGKIRYVGEYKGDEKFGHWSFYDEEGNLVKEEDY